jgi:hypothetical protein
MTELEFAEDKIKLSAFDYRNLAENYEKEGHEKYISNEYESALGLLTRARDCYIVWGASQSKNRCQRYIDFCLIKLGRMDPRAYGIGHVDEEEKPRRPRKKKTRNNS